MALILKTDYLSYKQNTCSLCTFELFFRFLLICNLTVAFFYFISAYNFSVVAHPLTVTLTLKSLLK